VAEQVRAAGGTPLVLSADVSQRAEAERAVRAAIEYWGTLDLLINNAGRELTPFYLGMREAYEAGRV